MSGWRGSYLPLAFPSLLLRRRPLPPALLSSPPQELDLATPLRRSISRHWNTSCVRYCQGVATGLPALSGRVGSVLLEVRLCVYRRALPYCCPSTPSLPTVPPCSCVSLPRASLTPPPLLVLPPVHVKCVHVLLYCL